MNTLSNSREVSLVYPPPPLYAPKDGFSSSSLPPSYPTSEVSFELEPITPVTVRIAPLATKITKEKDYCDSNIPRQPIINNETANNPSAINEQTGRDIFSRTSRHLVTALPLIFSSSILNFSWVKFGDGSINWSCKLSSNCDFIDYMPDWLKTCRNLIYAAMVFQLLNVVFFILSCLKRFKNRKIIIFSVPFLASLFTILGLSAVIITSSNIEKWHPKPAYAGSVTNVPYNGEYGPAWYLAVVSVALSSFILIFYFWVVTYFAKKNSKHGYEP